MGNDNEMYLREMICEDESWMKVTQGPESFGISYAEPSELPTSTTVINLSRRTRRLSLTLPKEDKLA
jgi:hypothetical protein